LAQGENERCRLVLEKIEQAVQSDGDRFLYPNRYAELTRTQLAIREMRWNDALMHLASVQYLAIHTDDSILKTTAILTKADILQRRGDVGESVRLLVSVAELSNLTPELSAYYERLLG